MSEAISIAIWGTLLYKYHNGEEISFEEESVLFFALLVNNYELGKKLSRNDRCTLFWRVLDYYNRDKVHPNEIRYMKTCRRIIKYHHDTMKDDPERLSSKFLLELTGCKCDKLQD
jgi:hypothetical protein